MTAKTFGWLITIYIMGHLIMSAFSGGWEPVVDLNRTVQAQEATVSSSPTMALSFPLAIANFFSSALGLLTWNYGFFSGYGNIIRLLLTALTALTVFGFFTTVTPVMIAAWNALRSTIFFWTRA